MRAAAYLCTHEGYSCEVGVVVVPLMHRSEASRGRRPAVAQAGFAGIVAATIACGQFVAQDDRVIGFLDSVHLFGRLAADQQLAGIHQQTKADEQFDAHFDQLASAFSLELNCVRLIARREANTKHLRRSGET